MIETERQVIFGETAVQIDRPLRQLFLDDLKFSGGDFWFGKHLALGIKQPARSFHRHLKWNRLLSFICEQRVCLLQAGCRWISQVCLIPFETIKRLLDQNRHSRLQSWNASIVQHLPTVFSPLGTTVIKLFGCLCNPGLDEGAMYRIGARSRIGCKFLVGESLLPLVVS